MMYFRVSKFGLSEIMATDIFNDDWIQEEQFQGELGVIHSQLIN